MPPDGKSQRPAEAPQRRAVAAAAVNRSGGTTSLKRPIAADLPCGTFSSSKRRRLIQIKAQNRA
jgi:hypothetical protein